MCFQRQGYQKGSVRAVQGYFHDKARVSISQLRRVQKSETGSCQGYEGFRVIGIRVSLLLNVLSRAHKCDVAAGLPSAPSPEATGQ